MYRKAGRAQDGHLFSGGAAQGAEEDLAVARILANRFADAAAAVIALASAAYVTLGRRW